MTLTADTPETVPPSGPAIYFDGTCSARNDVVVEAGTAGLQIFAGDRHLLDEWLYAELRRQAAPDGVLRLGRHGETLLARLEIRDTALAGAIEDRAVTLDRGGAAERKLRRKVVILSLAAVVSLIFTAIIGVPVLATRVTPLIPISVEQKLGKAVDSQIRATLDTKHLGAGFRLRRRRKRGGGTCRPRQACRPAPGGSGAAISVAGGRGAASGFQCLRAARRPHLRVPRD